MPAYEILAALVAGLLLGSFLNVCISRLPQHRSIVRPSSHCPRCRTPIAPWDNVPLVSYALLRGRCRSCLARISVRYPIVEALSVALTLACVFTFGFDLSGCLLTTFCLLLLALAVCDLETLRLPDSLTLPLLGLGIVDRASGGFYQGLHHGGMPVWQTTAALALRASISAVAAALLLLAIRWCYFLLRRRQGMGLGDVKLAAGIAAWLGIRQMAVVFFLAIVLGAVSGLIAVALRGRQTAETASPLAVPFGTFLAAAGIYGIFFGQLTLDWYLRFFP